jgi:hypothetical protein
VARLQHIPLFVCGSLLLGIHLGVCAPPNLLVYLGGRQPVDRYHMLALLACRVFSFIKSILQVARTRFVCVGAIACAHFLCLHLRSTLVRFLAPGVLVPDPENAVVVSARVLCMCGKGEARRPLIRSNATTCAPALHTQTHTTHKRQSDARFSHGKCLNEGSKSGSGSKVLGFVVRLQDAISFDGVQVPLRVSSRTRDI